MDHVWVYFASREMSEWHWASIPSTELNIAATLRSGQTFRWTEASDGTWSGAIGSQAFLIRPSETGIEWRAWPDNDAWEALRRYFALDVDLPALYKAWIDAEPRIAPAVKRYAGLRILRQGAEEAFFSFLCASCNTIVKITRSIQALERRAGEPIAEIDGQALYRFPSAARIAALKEADLRADLWGYRAPRLLQLARYVDSMGPSWLEGLRDRPYGEAHARLTEMFGIGAKIADCICLFGLWHDEAVPIDTHIRRIGSRLFSADAQTKTLTPRIYWQLADRYRMVFGPMAGWAQQYLFMEDLRQNRQQLPEGELAGAPGS